MNDYEADMRCRRCECLDYGRLLPDMSSREEALEATLTCPSCDLEDGLVVIESTLKKEPRKN